MTTHKIHLHPSGETFACAESENLLAAMLRADIPFVTDCGGEGKCGKCAVQILAGEYSCRPHHHGQLDQSWTLACLTTPKTDLEIWIPETGKVSIITSADEIAAEFAPPPEITSMVREIKTIVPEANEADNSADLSRTILAFNKSGTDSPGFTLQALRKLPHTIRTGGETLFWIDTARNRIIDIDSAVSPRYGIAVDLGTTTVDVLLADLETGEILARAGGYNLQMTYGSDIIHRIISAGKKGNARRLKNLALRTINELIQRICDRVNVKREEIFAAAIAGNTTMIHLLLEIDPASIRLDPYVPAAVSFPIYLAGEIGLKIQKDAPVFIIPGVSSYVGGDIVSGLSSLDFNRKLTLYLDLGTNGEIVIGDGSWFAGCACSCGPAFEGGGIACGMRAMPGAVDKFWITSEGEMRMDTIDDEPPAGFCGSGLIDLMAGLFKAGIIDSRGRFRESAPQSKIVLQRRRKAFQIPVASGKILTLNEAEVDNLIRTKGALMAGIRCLLKELSLDIDKVEKILVAGNFGKHLNMENAITIGLLPDLPRKRFEFIGNASLKGAYFAIMSEEYRRKGEELSRQVTNIELSTLPGYNDEFIAACFLPHTDLNLFPSARSKSSSL
ncbi:MAG: DUF4445 domain-containing protein [candidate division Zixibacteria bacterium]|nr:DUF4445 domain-containing protein [Candidatus Tariuqbacter arcticus]